MRRRKCAMTFLKASLDITVILRDPHCLLPIQGDPNPLVASEGIATLEKAGIEVGCRDEQLGKSLSLLQHLEPCDGQTIICCILSDNSCCISSICTKLPCKAPVRLCGVLLLLSQVSIMDGPESDACYEINAEFMARMKAESASKS